MGEVCNFIPLKKGADPCAIPPSVTFGDKKYCKSHSKTRQALQAKAQYDRELERIEKERLEREVEEKKQREELLARELLERERAERERLEKESLEKERLEKEKAEKILESPIPDVDTLPKFPFQKEVVEIGDEIVLNAWGRMEDPKSNYVFYRQKCYGRQLPNGEVAVLSPKDIKFLDKNDIPHIEEDSEEEEEEEEIYEGEPSEGESSEGEEEEGEEEEENEISEEESEEETEEE